MKKINKLISPLLIIFIGAILRLVPHVPNFAPITAMALFGGVYLNKRYALIIPLLTMIVSDYLLLYINPFGPNHFNFKHLYSPLSIWYDSTIISVYGSFLVTGLIGIWLKSHKSVLNIIFACIISSIQFFLITNAAVWINGMYDRSLIGLWESYIAGIPFLRFTMLGDLFYSGVFFGGYELVLQLTKLKKSAYAK
jgi:hypothetical protein